MLKIVQKLKLWLWLSLAMISLSACQNGGMTSAQAQHPLNTFTPQDYLQLADIATGTTRYTYQLAGAKKAINNHQYAQAESILRNINTNELSEGERFEYNLLQAQTASALGNFNRATQLLSTINPDSAPDATALLKLYRLKSQTAFNLHQLAAGIDAADQILTLTDSAAIKRNTAQLIWEQLTQASLTELQTALNEPLSTDTQGWLTLSQIMHTDSRSPLEFMQRIENWKATHPNHPASQLMQYSALTDAQHPLPKQIALLVPLSGPYAKQGQAIKDGFISAYYQHDPAAFHPHIRVFDTAKANVLTLAERAEADGAQWIVGPLLKANVENLEKNFHDLPVLALNVPNSQASPAKNFYEFGLIPEDEVEQTAQRIINDQHFNLLIDAQKNRTVKRLVNSLTQFWQQAGGTIIDTVWFKHAKALPNKLKYALSISQTWARKTQVSNTLHRKLRFIPRRREDFDAVFMLTNSIASRQIVPLLQYYFAGDVPVYGLTSAYDGVANPRSDRDLNHVVISNIPWNLHRAPTEWINTLRQSVAQNWPSLYRQQHVFFALGIDAYRIIPSLSQLTLMPGFGIPGATGTLYLLKNHRIYRSLTPTQFRNGIPVPV